MPALQIGYFLIGQSLELQSGRITVDYGLQKIGNFQLQEIYSSKLNFS